VGIALQHHARAIWRSIFTRSRQYDRTRGQGARLLMKTGPRDKKVAMLIAGEELNQLKRFTVDMSEAFGLDKKIKKYAGKRSMNF
jgi:hypothetical protein